MKKLFWIVGLVGILVSGVFGANIPDGYSKIYSEEGFTTYKNGNIYVSVVDLQKCKVKFGNVDKASSGNSFTKHNLDYWWNNIEGVQTAIFNGQFFNPDIDPTPLSFPLLSSWNTLVTQVDPGDLRTLKIYDNAKEAQILDDYYSYYLNNSKELIVGLHPSVDKKKNSNIGRFYIGGLHYNSSSLRYLLFFVSKSSTQATMNSEISKWGVAEHEVVMMDGSGSAQMKTSQFSVYGRNSYYLYDKRDLPNVISINRIWR
jgi:hypothetical protein